MAATAATTLLQPSEAVGWPLAAHPSRFYRPELDVLRFFAFLSVFLCHLLPAEPPARVRGLASLVWSLVLAIKDAGNFGVCIFFLLSSYLITELLRQERVQTNATHLRSFYMRRILRIWPLYFAVLLVFIIGGSVWAPLHIQPGRVLAYLLLVGNWYMVVHPLTTGPLRSLWSISVEEQFYVTWPFLIKAGGIRCIKAVSLALLPVSFLTILVASFRQVHPDVTVWLNSVVQFQFFALGALLAIHLSGQSLDLSPRFRAALLLAGAILWLLASGACRIKRAGFTPSPQVMLAGYAAAALGSVLIFLAVLGVAHGKLPQSLIYLGKISYGLYVFHEIGLSISGALRRVVGLTSHTPALFLLNGAVALSVTIILAALSYRYLEHPFLQLKRRFTFVESRSA
jgi:peptidoglycan/LPS O-acetylase OafA/YrhL